MNKFQLELDFAEMMKLNKPIEIKSKDDLFKMAKIMYNEIFKDIINTGDEFQLFVKIMHQYMLETEKDNKVSQEDIEDIQKFMLQFSNLGKCKLNSEIFPNIIKNIAS